MNYEDIYNDYEDYLMHRAHKYIKKYKSSKGKWVYVYADKTTHDNITKNAQGAKDQHNSAYILEKRGDYYQYSNNALEYDKDQMHYLYVRMMALKDKMASKKFSRDELPKARAAYNDMVSQYRKYYDDAREQTRDGDPEVLRKKYDKATITRRNMATGHELAYNNLISKNSIQNVAKKTLSNIASSTLKKGKSFLSKLFGR